MTASPIPGPGRTGLDRGVITRRAALVLGLGVGAGAVLGTRPAAATTVLDYEYKRQNTQSWCSAASSRIALSAVIGRRALPTQARLANQLGLVNGAGLQDPTLIATVLNRYTDVVNGHRYVFRIAPSGELKSRLRMRVHESVDRGYPVVINMNSVAGDTYSAGHYIAIVGYRANGYKIADPDEPTRNGVWYTEDQIVAWNKLNRFTAFS